MDGLKMIWTNQGTPQYYPVIHTIFWIEHKLWGLNTFGYHFVNMLLHMINALLLYRVIRKIYPRAAFAAALLFAIHPIQVETVAWITELKNLLSLCFFLLAFLSYLEFDISKRVGHYVKTLGLFICALLSKSISVCFAFVPIIYKWWRNGRIGWRDIRLAAPFFFIGLLSGLHTVYLEAHRVGARGHEFGLTLLDRLVLAGRILLFYIYKICIPFKFMFFYPRWRIDVTQWWQWLFLIISTAILVSLFCLRNRIGRGAFALFLFYIISIFPALGFINVYPMVFSFVADHFSYLSTPILFLLLVSTVIFLFDKIKERIPGMADKFYRLIWGVLAVPLIAYLCFKSMILTGSYKDQITLWGTLIRKNPDLWVSYINLGRIYEGMNENRKAISLYKKAIELNSGDSVTYYNLGNIYLKLGMNEKAVFLYKKTLTGGLRHPDIYNNLGLAYGNLGEKEEAIRLFRMAVEMDPNYENAVINLIRLTKKREISDEEEPDFTGKARLLNDLGVAQGKAGNIDKAIVLFDQAIEIDPAYAESYNNLGYAYFKKGEYGRAKECFEKALEIDPEHEKAGVNLNYLKNRDTAN